MGFIRGLMQQYNHFRAIILAKISARSVQVDGSWEPTKTKPAPMTLPIVLRGAIDQCFIVLAL